ncbi:conserved hypothetical protein [Talaromyces marneffei ATCC 18224]|uniref:Uncharacterized protein n=1 Tax=Talaromyces marneffei (strain ATCC 18224 / CBS 334.59 / QM 7333) TaxID=441960 RepID=B6QI50_TALMQ|nr:conserved hypothetical protein [Talaromyces marneffei ATCC 18224]
MSLQRSSQLGWPLCRSCALLLPSRTISATTIIADRSATRHYTASASHQRGFIRKSPAAKNVNKGYGRILNNTVPTEQWQKNYHEVKTRFEKNYKSIYSMVQSSDLIAGKITPKVFLEIGRRLVDQAYNSRPTADALKSIWKGDPATVHEIGRAIWLSGPWEGQVSAWARVATADAGFPWALCQEVTFQIQRMGIHAPTSREMEAVKKLAYEKEDPRALMVWADIARRWGRTEEALDLYRHLNDMAYPSNRRPSLYDDITFRGDYKAPWRILADMYNEAERHEEADEMMKVGALHYRDPQALVTYAYLRKEKDDWESYEQCMLVAAMSGHGEACYRLGNYYYLISKGEVPSRDQRIAQKHPKRAWIASWFARFFRKMDWRRRAINWYEMASAHGDSEGTRNLAVLMREDGHPEALDIFSRLRADSGWWNHKHILKLRIWLYNKSTHNTTTTPELHS